MQIIFTFQLPLFEYAAQLFELASGSLAGLLLERTAQGFEKVIAANICLFLTFLRSTDKQRTQIQPFSILCPVIRADIRQTFFQLSKLDMPVNGRNCSIRIQTAAENLGTAAQLFRQLISTVERVFDMNHCHPCTGCIIAAVFRILHPGKLLKKDPCRFQTDFSGCHKTYIITCKDDRANGQRLVIRKRNLLEQNVYHLPESRFKVGLNPFTETAECLAAIFPVAANLLIDTLNTLTHGVAVDMYNCNKIILSGKFRKLRRDFPTAIR